MKLLAPGTGWAASAQAIFWTTDGGAHWENIAPSLKPAQNVASVYFLDTTTGWALLSRYEDPQPEFFIAATKNSGAHWTLTRVKLPPNDAHVGPSGRLDFVDALHGWMNLDVDGSSNFAPGFTLRTDDGGKTWTIPISRTNPGVAGSLRFITPEFGWLAGGPGDEHLYVTRDGGLSWQEMPLKSPPQTGAAVYPAYDVPTFQDSQHGFLPVTYSGPEGSGVWLVVYATEDGGRTWRQVEVFSNLPIIWAGGVPLPFAVVEGSTVVALSSGRSVTLRSGGKEVRSAPVMTNDRPWSISRVSFVTGDEGWILGSVGLLSTRNGGSSWMPRHARTNQGPSHAWLGRNRWISDAAR